MLHRSCDYATVRGNVVENNVDSGVAVYESSNCEISKNNLSRNKSESWWLGCGYNVVVVVESESWWWLWGVACTSLVFGMVMNYFLRRSHTYFFLRTTGK